MEKTLKIHIRKLPEGLYIATSEDIQGLIAQGKTVIETIEIARDVAQNLREALTSLNLPAVGDLSEDLMNPR